jgi:hypothetical protein
VRNRYSYCFRLKVPPDLQTAFARKELRYSLRTLYLNEIAGLFLDDIKQDDGVWYFDLFSRKSRPNAARRIAPIHPYLLGGA